MQYHIIMIDYGGHRGFEAVVHPEQTRRQVIEEVRDIIACDTRRLEHVKFVDGDDIEDVTDTILDECVSPALRLAILSHLGEIDHAHDLRKHSEAAE